LKKILLVADIQGWAFDIHCQEIKKRLSNKYQIEIAYCRGHNIKEMSKKFDLVYVLDPMPISYPEPEKTIMGLRCEWLYEMHPNGPQGLYEDGLNGRCVSIKDKCSIFHVISEKQYNNFKNIVDDKPFLLVSQGVNHDKFNPENFIREAPTGTINVGTAGRSNSDGGKGFDIVHKVCEELGISHYGARYKKKLSHDQMPIFYKNIDVYTCMSKSEGFCNPILEAGIMEVPVITTNVGVASQIIKNGKNGFIIERNKEDLKKHLNILKDNNLRVSMGRELRKDILKEWTWDKKIEEYDNMFQMNFKMRRI
jgi:glycosyltransferase involved in cell wall biosynthesis